MCVCVRRTTTLISLLQVLALLRDETRPFRVTSALSSLLNCVDAQLEQMRDLLNEASSCEDIDSFSEGQLEKR